MTGKTRILFLLAVLASVLFAPPRAYAVIIERVVSTGGIEAWLVRDHTNPIITMRFAFRGGAALDPEGRDGLANMVSALLDEGAGDLDSKTFQGRLEDLVITLHFTAGRDNFGGRLRTLVENKDTAFELLTLALSKPRFDAEPLERIRTQLLSSLRQQAEEPNAIAGKTLFKTLFPSHPYGRPVDGTLESVAAITQADLKGFARRRLAKDNLTIGVVGDITAEALKLVLDKIFGGLPAKAGAWAIPEAVLKGQGRTVVVTKPGPQSAIIFADKGLKRQDPDFYAAFVMNHVLGGGGFTSRLYNTVREERGLAYSVYSTLHPLDRAGLIFGGAGTANKSAAETIAVMRAEWTRMATEGMSEKELADAKTFLTGSYSLGFTSSGRIASMLIGIQMDNLGIDYPDRRNGLIEAVTLADVNRMAAKYMLEDRLTIVVVGQPEGVTPTQ